jgi:glutathione synthetase
MQGESEQALLAAESQAWASAHGVLMGASEALHLNAHAPVTLLPTRVDRSAFQLAQRLAQPYNTLVDRTARDLEWVYGVLSGVLDGDPFTARLVELCRAVEAEGVVQRCYLGINRSDYMLDRGVSLLQVEINTIAASFGCLSSRVSRLHRYLLERHGAGSAFVREALGGLSEQALAALLPVALPANGAEQGIARALGTAAKLHRARLPQQWLAALSPERRHRVLSQRPLVVFVVQDGERNSFDQRWLEYELGAAHGVDVTRRSLGQIRAQCRLEGASRELLLGEQLVSVVYFRAGYTPNDYPSEAQWEGRLLAERSGAIKCPCIQYHIVGAKKVQQALAKPGAVERFLDPAPAALVRSSFAGLWTLDAAEADAEALRALEQAKADPSAFVVKPQREGGGNNFYGAEARKVLTTASPRELASHILMQRIFPVAQEACLMRKGEVVRGPALQELGIYGTFLGDGGDGGVLLNEQVGHLLRTKQVGVDEGGVAAGFSCLDSPFLIPHDELVHSS